MTFLCCHVNLNVASQESWELLPVLSEGSNAFDRLVKRELTGFLSLYH